MALIYFTIFSPHFRLTLTSSYSPDAWGGGGGGSFGEHLMNKDNHLFLYVPGSLKANKVDVANHGNVAGTPLWMIISKWRPIAHIMYIM